GLFIQTNPMYLLLKYNQVVFKWLVNWLFNARNRIADLIECWRELVKLTPGCDPDEVLALAVLRGVVRMLERFRTGVHFPVVAMTELQIYLPQLDRALEYLIESACPSKIPEPHATFHALSQDQIDEKTAECWLKAHGVSPDVWGPVFTASSEHLSARETIEWCRRNEYTDAQTRDEVEARGWVRIPDLQRIIDLYDELPTVGDFLHFMARNVFDQHYVDDYLLEQGFEDRF